MKNGTQTGLRLPAEMLEALHSRATANGHSLGEETRLRLQHSLETVRVIRSKITVVAE